LGAGGNGINLNLKYGAYSNIEIDNFTMTDVGASDRDGLDEASHPNGGAIVIEARDDAPSYSGNPAILTNVTIHDGTIDGHLSTGIHVGEPGKDNGSPDVTVTNVAIGPDVEHSGDHGDIANESLSIFTITGTGQADSLLASGDSDGVFHIDGGGGDDMIGGGSAADVLNGGAGNDTFFADASDTIVEAAGGGTDEVRSTESIVLPANVENLTLLDGASNTETFEDFTPGAIDNGENGWAFLGGPIDQEVIVDPHDGGNQVFRMSSDPASGAFAGPYSPALPASAGEPQTTADFDSMQITFTFQAVAPGDNSRVEVDFGLDTPTDRDNFMAIENIAGSGLRIAVADPLLNGTWDTGDGIDDFTAFTGNRTLVGGLDATQEYQLTMVMHFNDGADNDTVDFYLDGKYIGSSTSFENYRDSLGGTHLDNAEANQVASLFFRANGAGAPADGPGGENQGFLFDDIQYSVFDQAGPSGTGNSLDNVITGNSGDNILSGLGGKDTLIGGLGNDTLYGGTGNDLLFGGIGNDVLNGGANNDTLNGGIGNDTLNGDDGADHLNGDDGNDTLNGGNNNDILNGGAGTDTLNGGAGDDDLDGGTGADAIDGGTGNDTAHYSVTLTADDISFVNGHWVVSAAGIGGDDTLVGVEFIEHAGGRFLLVGGNGFATVNDAAALATQAGDLILSAVPAAESDVEQGASTEDLIVVLPGSTPSNVETGSGDDTVKTGDGDDTVKTGDGNDFVETGDGNDTIIGGSGNGDDVYDGGLLNDTIVYSSATSGVHVDLRVKDHAATAVSGADGAGPNPDTIGALLVNTGHAATTPVGFAEGDEIGTDALLNIENAVGGMGRDVLIGNAEANKLAGAGGRDNIRGGGGDDVLEGGAGRDKLKGGSGDDTLIGGAHHDTLKGGSGDDAFVFGPKLRPAKKAMDKIVDFQVKHDTIHLDHVAFKHLDMGAVASSDFGAGFRKASHDKHELYYQKNTGILYYDKNGNKSGGDIAIAKLDAHLNLDADHLLVI
ncbi:MAG: hypothetical protein KDJ88_06435, partial [Bauldia sp.]|nr:hypothetical protein [Bauldia sp.]